MQQEIASHRRTGRIPIVVVTGTSDTIDAACVLRKPVTPERLIDVVQACLRS
jgi:CheY-like chemotaxis protein